MISGRKSPFFDRAGLGVSTGSRFPDPKKTQVGTSTRGGTQGSLPSGDGSSSRDEGNQLGTSGNLGTSRSSPCPNRAAEGEGSVKCLGPSPAGPPTDLFFHTRRPGLVPAISGENGNDAF